MLTRQLPDVPVLAVVVIDEEDLSSFILVVVVDDAVCWEAITASAPGFLVIFFDG